MIHKLFSDKIEDVIINKSSHRSKTSKFLKRKKRAKNMNRVPEDSVESVKLLLTEDSKTQNSQNNYKKSAITDEDVIEDEVLDSSDKTESTTSIFESYVCTVYTVFDYTADHLKQYESYEIGVYNGAKNIFFCTDDLSNINFFKEAHVPDAFLSAKEKRLLLHKLQSDCINAPKGTILIVGNGLYVYNEYRIFVFGGKVLNEDLPQNIEIKVSNESLLPMMKSRFLESQIAEEVAKYISVIPNVSVPLFYYSLLGALKPIFHYIGRDVDFILTILGVSGIGKTFVVSKLSLWLESQLNKRDAKDITSMKKLKPELDKMKGLNFLVDDFHECGDAYARSKQWELLDNLVRTASTDGTMPGIITTAEKIDGIASCIDRMVILFDLEEYNNDEKIRRVAELITAPADLFAKAAEVLCKTVIDNFETVREEIEVLMSKKYDFEESDESRAGYHYRFIYTVAMLYEKYICGGNKQLSKSDELIACIKNNMVKQLRMVKRARLKDANGMRDWIMMTIKAIDIAGKHNKISSTMIDFSSDIHLCAILNEKLYIPAEKFYDFLALADPCLKDTTAAIKELDSFGIIEREDKNHLKKRKSGRNFYVIKYRVLENIYRELYGSV